MRIVTGLVISCFVGLQPALPVHFPSISCDFASAVIFHVVRFISDFSFMADAVSCASFLIYVDVLERKCAV
jgi:hypothetical protein